MENPLANNGLAHAAAVLALPLLATTAGLGARVVGLTRIAEPAPAEVRVVEATPVEDAAGELLTPTAPVAPAERFELPEQEMVNEIFAAKLDALEKSGNARDVDLTDLRQKLADAALRMDAMAALLDALAKASQPLAEVAATQLPADPNCNSQPPAPSPDPVHSPSPDRGTPGLSKIIGFAGELPESYARPFDPERLTYRAKRSLAAVGDTYGGQPIQAEYAHARASLFGPTPLGNDPMDNGRSYWGFRVGEGGAHGVALPPAVYERVGLASEVIVELTNHLTGKTVLAPIVDVGPSNRVWSQQGPTVDITAAVADALGCQVVSRQGLTGATDITFKIQRKQ